jgi:hypothetical protein
MELNFGNRFQVNPADVFNKYYLNIIDDRKIQQANIESTKFSLKVAFCQGFAEIINIPITESEVKCTFKLLKIKNSSGYDRICNKVIKAGCDHISKPLTYILNMSLTQGTQGVFKKRPNFLNSSPTRTEGALRLAARFDNKLPFAPFRYEH